MLTNRVLRIGLVAGLWVVGCGGGDSGGDTAGDLTIDDNQGTTSTAGGGSGGSGGTGTTTTTTTTTTQTGAPTLQSVCEEVCDKVDVVSMQEGCNPTPNCAQDCIDYGMTVGECLYAYIELWECTNPYVTMEKCYCNFEEGDTLACDTPCDQENVDFLYCLEVSGP